MADALMTFIIIIAIFVAIIIAWSIMTYNRFITLDKQREEAWSGISVQLKLRHDLVPQLVAVVKGYAAHEKKVLEDITQLRSLSIASLPKIQVEESHLGHALERLIVLAERYPDLKASENFQDLFAALVKIEDDIQYARRYFNGIIRNYNILVTSFPSLLIARKFGYHEHPYFELESQKFVQVPEVTI